MAAIAARHGARVIEHDENKGLPAAWRRAWDEVEREPAADWVFQLEDDVEFERDVDLGDMIRTYAAADVPLTQLALARQPVYARDDYVRDLQTGAHGTEHRGFVTQSRYFLTLAAVYPREVVTRVPKDAVLQEHTVAQYFGARGMAGGVLGSRADLVSVRHIGLVSRGAKGPGFAHLPRGVDYAFDTGAPVP